MVTSIPKDLAPPSSPTLPPYIYLTSYYLVLTIRLRLFEPFQYGEIPTLIAHIEEGLRVFNECEKGGEGSGSGSGKGLLVFSGYVGCFYLGAFFSRCFWFVGLGRKDDGGRGVEGVEGKRERLNNGTNRGATKRDRTLRTEAEGYLVSLFLRFLLHHVKYSMGFMNPLFWVFFLPFFLSCFLAFLYLCLNLCSISKNMQTPKLYPPITHPR